MENTSPEKGAERNELHHAMDRAKNAPSSENIHHLIKVRSSFFYYNTSTFLIPLLLYCMSN